MDKGTKLRLTIHNILCDINRININLDNEEIKKIISMYEKRDISFIYNICLNTMRYSFHCEKLRTTSFLNF